jgi:protein TonB
MPKHLSVAGPLLLEAVIDKRGIVRSVRVLRDGTKPSLGPAYVKALKKWRFRPGTVNGQPVDVTYNMSVIIDVR